MPGDHGKLALHGVEFIAQPDLDVARPVCEFLIFMQIVGNDHDFAGAFGRDLADDLVDRQAPSSCWPPVIATASLKRILNVMLVPAAMAQRMARTPEWL